MKAKTTLLIPVLIFSALSLSHSQSIDTMKKISGSVIFPNGFESQVTWYTVGGVLARIEEAPMTMNGQTYQSLVVYKEPDIWMLDAATKTGKHIVDPGPTFGFHIPIVTYRGDLSWEQDMIALELGTEIEFMRKHNIPPVLDIDEKNPNLVGYRYDNGTKTSTVLLSYDKQKEVPVRIDIRRSNQLALTLVYDSFERELPIDRGLFEKPEGFEIQEAE